MSLLQNVILRDTRANQPAATDVVIGTLYFVTDELVTERSNGTTWQSYSDAGASAITDLTGDVTATGPGSVAATVANNAVTYAKMQDVSATSRILGRRTAGAGDTEECTLSQVLDFIGSATWGDILFRGTAAWQRLAAGTAGQVLQTNGAGADPSWVTPAGSSAAILGVRLAINEATLESLGTTPVQLVAAPGADHILWPLHWNVEITITTGYSTSPSFQLRLNGTTNSIINDLAFTWTVSGRQVWREEHELTTPPTFTYSSTDPRNRALMVQLTADPGTPGTGVGTAVVNVYYLDVTVT